MVNTETAIVKVDKKIVKLSMLFDCGNCLTDKNRRKGHDKNSKLIVEDNKSNGWNLINE